MEIERKFRVTELPKDLTQYHICVKDLLFEYEKAMIDIS